MNFGHCYLDDDTRRSTQKIFRVSRNRNQSCRSENFRSGKDSLPRTVVLMSNHAALPLLFNIAVKTEELNYQSYTQHDEKPR